jgi:hypothetical protein
MRELTTIVIRNTKYVAKKRDATFSIGMRPLAEAKGVLAGLEKYPRGVRAEIIGLDYPY